MRAPRQVDCLMPRARHSGPIMIHRNRGLRFPTPYTVRSVAGTGGGRYQQAPPDRLADVERGGQPIAAEIEMRFIDGLDVDHGRDGCEAPLARGLAFDDPAHGIVARAVAALVSKKADPRFRSEFVLQQ